MACNLTKGFVLDCRESVGGIKSMWVFNLDSLTIVTESSGIISEISGAASDFFEYELRRENASFTETINNSQENDTLFYTQELTFSLSKLDSTKRNELMLLAKAYVGVIILDNNGTYWLLGKQNGMVLGGTAESGAAYGDANGYMLTFNSNEPAPAQELHSGWVDDLV